MRQTLVKLCKNGYHFLSTYGRLREILAAQGDGNESLFTEMLHRISNGKYGQDSERQLIALKHNIIIRVYDASSGCWIVNQEAHPKSCNNQKLENYPDDDVGDFDWDQDHFIYD